jgi:acetoacetyl-CoA synthetase
MDAYYTRFPGRKVWAQGDFIYQDKVTKGLEILGRSDGVLNPVSPPTNTLRTCITDI